MADGRWIPEIILGTEACKREDCPYCDIEFLREQASAYRMTPKEHLRSYHIFQAWRALHPNVTLPPKIGVQQYAIRDMNLHLFY
jgi:hypothetical protein